MLIKEAAKQVKYPSIAIIGGGIGGLSVANALLHRNNVAGGDASSTLLTSRVSVYEQADHFIPSAGAGFGFSPNGQLCLSSIGIHDYRNFCNPFDTMKRIDKNGTNVSMQAAVFKELREKYDVGFAGCLRADLIDSLVNKLAEYGAAEEEVGSVSSIQYNSRLVGIKPCRDKVELTFDGGHEDLADLVIGADGYNRQWQGYLILMTREENQSTREPTLCMVKYKTQNILNIYVITLYSMQRVWLMDRGLANSLLFIVVLVIKRHSSGQIHMYRKNHHQGEKNGMEAIHKNFMMS